MQKTFYAYEKDTKLFTELSFEIFEIITEKEKVYSDDEFIKDCLELFTRRMFSEKKCVVKHLVFHFRYLYYFFPANKSMLID